MKKVFIGIIILVIVLILGFMVIRRLYYDFGVNVGGYTGGYRDNTNKKAPKIIESKEITYFSYSFIVQAGSDLPSGRKVFYEICDFSLKKQEDGAWFKGSGYSEYYDSPSFDLEFSAPLSALDDLQEIIDRWEVSKINGRSEHTIGIPENLGASIRVEYASGERISATDNSGPILSSEANKSIYDFFINLAIEEDSSLLDSNDED